MNKKIARTIAHAASFIIPGIVLGLYFGGVIGNPSARGGKIATVIQDPSGDDHGFGSLAYPEGKGIKPGSLDLVRYTVHEPVRGRDGSGRDDYWQIDFAFAGSSAEARNVRVYIDADGDGAGSIQTKKEFAEGVEFDRANPWDFVLSIHGTSGSFASADGKLDVLVRVSESASGKNVSARIPLADPALAALAAVPTTWQYVLVGAYDPACRDGFAGTPPSEFTPKLYDILVPDGRTQEEALSAWDEKAFSVPVLSPVTVAMRAVKKSKGGEAALSPEALARLRDLERASSAEEAAAIRAAASRVSSLPDRSSGRAIALFDAGRVGEAETAFDALLSASPNDPVALAYKGSLVAMRGGKALPLKAMGLVKEAYTFLDRAVSLAHTPDEARTAYIARGNVSQSIPEAIFRKAASGAEDFLAAAERIKQMKEAGASGVSDADVADAYRHAAECYALAGKADRADSWFAESRKLMDSLDPAVGPGTRLALFRHFEMAPTSDGSTSDTAKRKDSSDAKKSAEYKESEARLAEIDAKLASSPNDVPLLESALELMAIHLDKIPEAIDLASAHESALKDSKWGQIYLAVAECKMANTAKETLDKVDWVNKGMRRFDAANRRWPNDEDVYLYMTMTYSYFPQEMAMREQTLDLLSVMEKKYAAGTWKQTDGEADIAWLAIGNLLTNYPEGAENQAIRDAARKMQDALPTMAARPLAKETLHE
jgi:predicted Zn-dependent protease